MNQTQLRLIRDVNADIAALEKQAAEKRRRLDEPQALSLGILVCAVLLLSGLALTLVSAVHW